MLNHSAFRYAEAMKGGARYGSDQNWKIHSILQEGTGHDSGCPRGKARHQRPGGIKMLELCELLKINVNELLSGERIMAEAYDKRAEENLLAMRREVEEKNRQMLQTEYWIAIPAVIAGLIMVFVASFLEMPVWLRIALIAGCELHLSCLLS